MDETNFGESRSGYRLVRNNSFEFPQVSGGFQALHQRRPSYVRNSCVTPDAYNNKGFFRYYDQDQSMWNFPSCNKDQSSCKCSASTPKIHQALEFDPRHEGFLYLPRSHSPAPSIPSYYSLKANPSKKKKEVQHFSDSKTLGRHKGKNHSSLIINSAWSPKENVKNCHSERCLKWLQSSTDFESMEEQMKELDMNIELLKWKRKHLESVHQQKMQSLQQGSDVVNSHQSDSPPPPSDIMKPDISIDDGFESVADTCNNPLMQNFSELESELRKQQQKTRHYELMFGKYRSEVENLKENFKKQETRHKAELEKLRNFYEKKGAKERSTEVEPPSDASREKPRAVRPKSFKRELFPACQGGCGGQSNEVLNLKAELIIKDQHLKKLRATLKELSSRHNELLDLHMMLVKSQSKSSSDSSRDSTQLIEDLGHVVDDFQKIFNSVGQAGRTGNLGINTPSPATTPSGEQLTKLQQSVERLKLEVRKRCPEKQSQPSKDCC